MMHVMYLIFLALRARPTFCHSISFLDSMLCACSVLSDNSAISFAKSISVNVTEDCLWKTLNIYNYANITEKTRSN